jgi:hypothetical protein
MQNNIALAPAQLIKSEAEHHGMQFHKILAIQNARSDPLSITGVLQRVLIEQYQVSELAHFNCAKRIFNPQKSCRAQGGNL